MYAPDSTLLGADPVAEAAAEDAWRLPLPRLILAALAAAATLIAAALRATTGGTR